MANDVNDLIDTSPIANLVNYWTIMLSFIENCFVDPKTLLISLHHSNHL